MGCGDGEGAGMKPTTRLLLPFYSRAVKGGRADLAAFWLKAVERAESLRAAKQVAGAGGGMADGREGGKE